MLNLFGPGRRPGWPEFFSLQCPQGVAGKVAGNRGQGGLCYGWQTGTIQRYYSMGGGFARNRQGGVLGSFAVMRRQACFAWRGRTEESNPRLAKTAPSLPDGKIPPTPGVGLFCRDPALTWPPMDYTPGTGFGPSECREIPPTPPMHNSPLP